MARIHISQSATCSASNLSTVAERDEERSRTIFDVLRVSSVTFNAETYGILFASRMF